MGLDMYLTGRKFFWQTYASSKGNEDEDRREDGRRVTNLDVELGYWRKHPNLHGYIVQGFANGKDDCREIELTADNLRSIIAAVKAKKLPNTTGFFFGESDTSKRQIAADVKVLESALDWLEEGDSDPFEREELPEAFGVSATVYKAKPDDARDKPQRVSRSVHYRASW